MNQWIKYTALTPSNNITGLWRRSGTSMTHIESLVGKGLISVFWLPLAQSSPNRGHIQYITMEDVYRCIDHPPILPPRWISFCWVGTCSTRTSRLGWSCTGPWSSCGTTAWAHGPAPWRYAATRPSTFSTPSEGLHWAVGLWVYLDFTTPGASSSSVCGLPNCFWKKTKLLAMQWDYGFNPLPTDDSYLHHGYNMPTSS